MLLASGCICCSIRGDLNGALRGLLGRRDRAEIPAFDRVVIETTGLADPGPILYTLLNEPVLQHHFQLGNVIATVDAVECGAAPGQESRGHQAGRRGRPPAGDQDRPRRAGSGGGRAPGAGQREPIGRASGMRCGTRWTWTDCSRCGRVRRPADRAVRVALAEQAAGCGLRRRPRESPRRSLRRAICRRCAGTASRWRASA